MIRHACLALALAACSTPKAPAAPAPAPAPPSAPRGPAAIDLTMAKRTGPGASVPIAPGESVSTGELVELHVEVDQPGYVYVAQFFGDGTFELLYPTSDVIDRVPAHTRLRIPSRPGAWLKISGSPGEEHVHVLFTATPLTSVSPGLAAALGLTADPRASAPAPAPTPPPAPSPARKPAQKAYTRKGGASKPLLVTYDPGSKELTEVLVDDAPVDISSQSGIAVRTFAFTHAN